MKTLFTFSFFIFSITIKAQIPSFEAVVDSMESKYPSKSIDSTACRNYYETALSDHKDNNLELSYLDLYDSIYYQKTFWKVIENETPFKEFRKSTENDLIRFIDDTPKERDCYGDVVRGVMKKLYGPDFLTYYKNRADEMDSLGNGYIYPFFSKKNIYKLIEKKSRISLSLDKYWTAPKSVLASLTIAENGDIINVYCFYRPTGPRNRSLPFDNPHVQEVHYLLSKLGKINPATFLNSPVEGEISLYFPFTE